VLYRTALPSSAVLVNFGVPGATVAEALEAQAGPAIELEPTMATVWLNVNDIIAGVSPTAFERDLGALVHLLRREGATRVFVANVPPLDQLPAYVACRAGDCGLEISLPGPEAVNQLVEAFNDATARVVTREQAVLVDLHAVGMAARQSGTAQSLVSDDGFHPSTAGHASVADAFARSVRASGPVG
jgi:lysophospholipase L1-like esterase